MEDDVDIYADLPNFDVNSEKNDQDCNCKELKKEINLLISKLENIQRIKINLENNLSSLLKTARAEITRKDKMIDDLNKRLDDVTFRRSNNYNHKLPHQHTRTRKYEDVSSMQSQENNIEETDSYQFYHDEYKSRKPQNDVNRISTIFGERLHKRITENEEKDKKQKDLLKLSADSTTKDISNNDIIENDKENGSQFSINNNDNKSNIERCSSSEPSYKKNLVKRTNEEDDTYKHKRVKIENDENKTMAEEIDYSCLTQYDLTDNLVQYEIKDSLVKSEDRLDAAHSFKKKEDPFCDERRASSEYRDIKQDRDCTNGWRNETKSHLVKDHNYSNIRNGHADNLRNSRTASTSNHVSEKHNNYKKNGYKYSPPRRSYSRNRSDYESNYRLRERSNRTYREKKYDDFIYDSRYRNDRLRSYKSEENDRKTRYRRGERGDLRDKYRYSSSDDEESSLYRNKYKNYRTRKEMTNVLNNKILHENDKAAVETNLRESSSRTTVNSIKISSVGKNIEQHRVKNESEINLKLIKSEDLSESTSIHVAKKDEEDIPEEGEILDSPEKINNFAEISEDSKIEEGNVKIVPVEDKNKDISVDASIDDKSHQNDADNTKQLEVADISTEKVEVTSCLLQENLNDCEEVIQLNSSKNDITVDEVHNCIKDEDKCKSHVNESLKATQNIEIHEQVHNSDINISDKNDTDKNTKNSITETAIKMKETTDSNIENVTKIKEIDESSIESATKMEEINNLNIANVIKIKEIDDSNIESATRKEEINNLNIENVVKITEINNLNSDDSIHQIGDDELRTSTAEIVTKVKVVVNCDIEDRDKSQTSVKNETSHQILNKSDIEICLNDHNYVQNPSLNVSDVVQKPSLRSECDEAILDTKEAKAKVTTNIQSVGIKRTIPVVKNKKDLQSKGILISHRRKAVILSDSNASMTVLMNTNIAKTSSAINNCNENSTLKPRACRISRVTAKATCK